MSRKLFDLNSHVFKLPEIKRIYLQYIPENNSELLQFLEKSSPDRLRILTFGWNSTARVKIDFYLDGLKKALKGVSKEVLANYWIYSKDSLEKMVKASANCERLIIRQSVTDCDQDLDFSGPVYKVKYFGFPYWGDYAGNAWSTNPDKLRRIIKAISESSMKESLTTLNILQCGVSIQNAKSLLNAYGMPIVNVVTEENNPLND